MTDILSFFNQVIYKRNVTNKIKIVNNIVDYFSRMKIGSSEKKYTKEKVLRLPHTLSIDIGN
jgi:hypothetical protein